MLLATERGMKEQGEKEKEEGKEGRKPRKGGRERREREGKKVSTDIKRFKCYNSIMEQLALIPGGPEATQSGEQLSWFLEAK